MKKFTTSFDKYACIGDSITAENAALTFRARIEPDTDSRVDDCECYLPEEIKLWKDDQWFFCGIVLSVECNGITIDDNIASLWGVECNLIDNNDYLLEVANDLLEDCYDSTVTSSRMLGSILMTSDMDD